MSDFQEAENTRIRLGATIVITSIISVFSCLAVILYADGAVGSKTTVTDKVALLGSVTTFLGAVVGVFFGVNASNANGSRNAAAASENIQVAGKIADAARMATETAQQASESAARSVDISHAMLRDAADGSRSLGAPRGAPAPGSVAPARAEVGEELAGDPDEPPTRTVFPAVQGVGLDTFARGAIHVAAPAPSSTLFSQAVLASARAEADAHVTRDSDRPRVTEYLNLLGLGFADGHGVPYRYCAAGLTWVVCRAYCDLNAIAYTDANRAVMLRSVLGDIGKYYFRPSASCQTILDDARARHTFASVSETPKPGYLVLYNWSGGQHAEHIGLVDSVEAGALHTIEFNTTAADGPNQGNGGAVSRKRRPLKFVVGYARTYA